MSQRLESDFIRFDSHPNISLNMYCPGNLPYLTWDFTDGARGLVILIVIVIIRWPGPLRHGHYLYLGVMILSHWVSLDWVLWVRDTGSVTLTERNDRGWPAERERSQWPHAAHVLSRCLAWVIDIVSIITLLCPSQYVLWIERSVSISISMRSVYLFIYVCVF